ncbi:hypothetical protein HK100_000066 [Physocladia obscura]|uniref:Uncharacterized protein n=1 Tax=Physocladia obscura TaxID=109957 RepID=A0AAD5XH77_9FUNG|nr:hypothetical protein HK100_000066 [Physocladia obscura]
MDSFDFVADTAFVAGLAAITTRLDAQGIDGAEREAHILQAKRFYYAKYIQQQQQQYDFTPTLSTTPTEPSVSSVSPTPAVTETPFESVIVSASDSQQQQQQQQQEQPVYPPTFAEICALVAKGEPVPGIRLIPTTVHDKSLASISTAQRRPKPWEINKVENVEASFQIQQDESQLTVLQQQ